MIEKTYNSITIEITNNKDLWTIRRMCLNAKTELEKRFNKLFEDYKDEDREFFGDQFQEYFADEALMIDEFLNIVAHNDISYLYNDLEDLIVEKFDN